MLFELSSSKTQAREGVEKKSCAEREWEGRERKRGKRGEKLQLRRGLFAREKSKRQTRHAAAAVAAAVAATVLAPPPPPLQKQKKRWRAQGPESIAQRSNKKTPPPLFLFLFFSLSLSLSLN